MSESINKGNESGVSAPGGEFEIPVEELDQSCRTPVLFMFYKAGGWLVLSALFGLLNSVRFHAPDLLAHCPWLTYGRVEAFASVAFVYGFALQAAFGVALWLVVRMSRTALVKPGFIFVGACFWNIGVAVGAVGILAGDGAPHILFELPKYAVPILLVAYALMAGLGLVAFLKRQSKELYVSQWFLFAAFLWFPWILTAATLLLQYFPVRGVAQVAIAGWYGTGLTMIVLGGIGLAILFYLIPKLSERPLHSRHMALFAFWLLLFFGNSAGILSGSTLPSWISGLSAAMSFFVCLAAALVGLNLYHTVGNRLSSLFEPEFRFVTVATVSFLLLGLLGAVNAMSGVAELTQFTLVLPALQTLALGGFIMMALFAGIYHILPRILGINESQIGAVNLHFWLSLGGLALTIGVLGLGGLLQGQTMIDPTIPFTAVTKSALTFLRLETVGSILLLAGSVVFMVNVGKVACRLVCCGPKGILSGLTGAENVEEGSETAASESRPRTNAVAPKRAANKAPKKSAKKTTKKAAAPKRKQAKKAAKKS